MQTAALMVSWICFFTELSKRLVDAGQSPNVTMNTTYFSWEAGQTVILRCHVSSSQAVIDSVFWIFETDNIFKTIYPSTNPEKYRGSSSSYPSLIVLNLTSTDVGSYRCAATNEFGTGISKTALFLNVTGQKPNVTATKHYYKVKLGENISLDVSIYSPHSALLSVKWLFHKNRLSQIINPNTSDKYIETSLHNSELLIVNLTIDDIGNYTCIAHNTFGIGESTQIMLSITEYLPSVKIEKYEYQGHVGRSVTMKCLVTSPGSPVSLVYWMFDDTKNNIKVNINASSKYEIGQSSNPSLLIKNLRFSDEGLYQCVASNSIGTGYSNWTSLSVKDIPFVEIGSELYNATYGESVTLDCKVSSLTSLNKIYWERNSSGIVINISSEFPGIQGVSIEHPGLTVNVATSSDSGIYTCVATNKYGIGKSNPTHLFVIGGIPVIKSLSTVINVTYGMNVTLLVSVHSAPKHFHIYWKKFGRGTTETIHTGTIGTSGGSISTPSLTIHNPTVSHVGIYECYAKNALGIGSSEKMSLVIVGDLPLVEVEVREHTAHFGDETTLNCTVRSYPNYERVYWEKRNGEEVTILIPETKGISGSTINTPSLTIGFVTSTDSGSYTCFAENIVGVGKSSATRLTVISGPPIVNIGSIFYTTVFGNPITLECMVIADPPVRYVFWHKNFNGYIISITHGAVGTQGISTTSPSLTIMFPTKSDQGEYECFAVNDLGERGSLPTLLKVSGGLPVVSVDNPFHTAKFGASYTLNCKVNADPIHTEIYWQHDTNGLKRIINKDTTGVSGVLLDNPKLTIDFITTSDVGVYTCFAENIVGIGNSKGVSLKVDGGIPTVDVPLTSYSVKHGDDVALLCTVISIPQCTNVYWIKETEKGDIVLNHGTTGTIGMTVANPALSLKPATTIDSGLYTCLASNIIGTGTSRPVSLIVTPEYKDDQDSSNPTSYNDLLVKILGPVLGTLIPTIGAAVLIKVLGCGKPNVVLQYKSCGKDLPPEEIEGNESEVTQSVIREGDKVELMCTCKGFLDIKHCTWYVQKKNSTKKIKLRKDVTGEQTRDKRMHRHYDETIKIKEEPYSNGFKAIITNMTKENEGKYSCKARNILRRENISGQLELIVQGVKKTSNTVSTTDSLQNTEDVTFRMSGSVRLDNVHVQVSGERPMRTGSPVRAAIRN